MNRPQAYFAFVLIAPLAAGLFGILHNQLSYSVAPEYGLDRSAMARPLFAFSQEIAMVGAGSQTADNSLTS